jgi:hypothetical protein
MEKGDVRQRESLCVYLSLMRDREINFTRAPHRIKLSQTDQDGVIFFCLVFALRPQTPKHIRGGWSHYTDTSEPVEGGVQL